MNTKYTKSNFRMDYDEIDEYLQSIINLKDKYQGEINIETGFEFEYFPNEIEHIMKMKSMVDKMILGQHFVFDSQGNIKYFTSKQEATDKDAIQYICLINKALQAGIPDIIAHPDLFFKYRKEFGKKEEFFTRQLCKVIQKYTVPVEINLNEIYREYVKAQKQIPDGTEQEQIKLAMKTIKYPNEHFWRILSEYDGIKVLFGIDAHVKGQIRNCKISYKIANEILGKTIEKLKFVDYKLDEKKSKKEEIEL